MDFSFPRRFSQIVPLAPAIASIQSALPAAAMPAVTIGGIAARIVARNTPH